MTASLQDIILDTRGTDDRAVLVLRGGRLTAVLSCLGAMHDDKAGQWFVEVIFDLSLSTSRRIFADPQEFIAWLSQMPEAGDDG